MAQFTAYRRPLRNSMMLPSPVRLTMRPMMHRDGGVDQVAAQSSQAREDPILVRSCEPGVPHDIGN